MVPPLRISISRSDSPTPPAVAPPARSRVSLTRASNPSQPEVQPAPAKPRLSLKSRTPTPSERPANPAPALTPRAAAAGIAPPLAAPQPERTQRQGHHHATPAPNTGPPETSGSEDLAAGLDDDANEDSTTWENLLERLTAAQETVEQQRDEESRAAIFWALGRDNEQEGSEPWRPPGDGAPATRKHAAMPNLEVTANGDLIVTDTSAAAYSANTEPDDEVRLSAAYARSLPAGVALLFLAPNGFDSGRQRSLKHRWQTAHTYISSIQADCLKRYSLAVSRWLAFAEESGVPPAERFPANSHALVDWIADLVCDKQFSKSYVSQHVDGLRFWHNLHLVPWDLDDAVRRQLMKGARVLAPPPADPRRGATVEDLQAVADVLLEEARAAPAELPKALAFMAAQSFAFFAIARIKDVTVGRQNDAKVTGRRLRPDESQTLRAFDPKYDASGANVTIYEESEELPPLVKIHLPWDKINKEKGVDIRAAEQSTLGKRLDPVSCMRKHLEANHPSAADPAFSYIGRNGKSRVKLTVGFFRKEVNRCLAARSRPPLAMHGFRIGGNNFYKMCKIDSQIIRSHGRRKSTDSYQLYQRELDEVARRVTANLSLPKGSQGADSRDQDSDWDSFDDDADNEE